MRYPRTRFRVTERWRRQRRGLPFTRAAHQLGQVIVVRGQSYLLTAFEPHRRKDGSKTRLAWWLTDCCECGWTFKCSSPCTAQGTRLRGQT
jgi:hypothetical protein